MSLVYDLLKDLLSFITKIRRKYKKPKFEIKLITGNSFTRVQSQGNTVKLSTTKTKILIYNKNNVPQTIEHMSVCCSELKDLKIKSIHSPMPVTVEPNKPQTIEVDLIYNQPISNTNLFDRYDLTFTFVDERKISHTRSEVFFTGSQNKRKE